MDLIVTLLTYMETPQYLRKRLFQLKPELQYAGIMPPLRTPHHPLKGNIRDLHVGDYREGVAVSQSREGTLVDIGAERPFILKGLQFPVNKRLTLQVAKLDGQLEVQAVDRAEIPDYWGYAVTVENRSLSEFLMNRKFSLAIGTSRFADGIQSAMMSMMENWNKAASVLLLFGSPARGLFEIAKGEGENVNDLVDFMLNTIPSQGTETVRTEEALLATLAILNVHFGI
jgi:hypothetical protein